MSYGIVIASYGRVDYVRDLIESIRKNVYYEAYEILVIDNSPFPEEVKNYCILEGIRYHIDPTLSGYSAVLNYGFNTLSKTHDFICMIDKDTLVKTEDWLLKLAHALIKNNLEMVTPLCRRFDGGLREYPFDYKPNEKGICIIPEGRYTDGYCYLVRNDWKYRWDENFKRAYYEDVDLCWQHHKDGKKIGVVWDVEVWHKAGGSHEILKKEGVDPNSFAEKNKAYFAKKWGVMVNGC